jgi:protoporphyrinogen oxidase
MRKYKYIILGAGPSGLAFAHTLKDRGENSFLVIEREADAGGLCRSATVDGGPLDVGGGHFLDVRRQRVLDFVFRFLPRDSWVRHSRISTIQLLDRELDYPLEANIWQLPVADQIDYLESIAQAGANRGHPMPSAFPDWIVWKLGGRIARDYMLPYNRKIWSMPLDRIGTYWLNKLPSVSFRDTLESCLRREPRGQLPAHGAFFYPAEYGYGEVWRRMGQALGNHLVCGCDVHSVAPDTLVVNGRWKAEALVTTVPWPCWRDFAPLPDAVRGAVDALCGVGVDITYVPANYTSRAHWIYEPDERLPHHRLLLRHNFSPGTRGHWTETNPQRNTKPEGLVYRNQWAYPVNTVDKPEWMRRIMAWAEEHRIIPVGRWGKWEHLNSDVAVEEAMDAAILAMKESRA